MSDIPVLYQTAGSFEKQLEQIITQKWIALFLMDGKLGLSVEDRIPGRVPYY